VLLKEKKEKKKRKTAQQSRAFSLRFVVLVML